MNVSKILSISIISFLSVFQFANSQELYGSNPQACKEKLSILTTYYKQKAYADGGPSLSYLLKNCPQASKNIYIIGNKVFETLIESAINEELKEKYIDSLILLQDWRIKYFPENKQNQIRADKAVYLLKYRLQNEYPQAFNLLDSSFKAGTEDLNYYDLYMYMYAYNLMVKTKKINCSNFVNDYLKVISQLNKQKQSGQKVDEKTVQKINDLVDVCIDCNTADSLYLAQFENSKTDTNWLDNGIQILSGKKCNNSNALLMMLEERFTTKKDISTATVLAKYYLSKQDINKTTMYIEKALSLAKDDETKAEILLIQANSYLSVKNYTKAFYAAKKSSNLSPSNHNAFLLQGDAIAYSVNSCAGLTFGGKELYWLAVDYYTLANSKAPDEEKSIALNKINQYKAYFPLKKDVFLKSINEGESYRIECGFNENTIVRTN